MPSSQAENSGSSTIESVSVERVVAGAADDVWALLADPARHAEFDGSGSVRHLKRGKAPLALGSEFVMAMKVGIPYTTASTIVEYEPGRLIAWQTYSTIRWLRRFGGGRIWRYELEPGPDGTLVRETWDVSQEAEPSRRNALKARTRKYMITNMRRSLERIDDITRM